MVDLDKGSDTIDKADKFINKLWGFLGRHWGKLIVLSIIGVVIWFCMLVKDEVNNTSKKANATSGNTEQVYIKPSSELEVVEDEIDENHYLDGE